MVIISNTLLGSTTVNVSNEISELLIINTIYLFKFIKVIEQSDHEIDTLNLLKGEKWGVLWHSRVWLSGRFFFPHDQCYCIKDLLS